ncbi:MAG: hypothetical protein KBF98_14045 [Rhodoferax sp.]|nr:hypothetical protein [Rhodoferax sp.]
MSFTGDRLIEIKVDQSAVNGLIENKNLVETEGGWVLMSAGAASSLGAGGINNTGIVRALSLSEHAGVIRLEGGTTRVGGVLDVSALGGHGGTVQVLGQQVEVAGGARIDASGSNGGGTVLVGGDYQGQNTAVPNAKTTLVAATASLKADATVSGDGGKIIAWADDTTRAHGDFSAQGGAQGGHGGLIETSGKRALDVTHARVNASAPKGSNGSWLLDPSDVYIVHGSAGALSGGVFDPNLPTSIGDTEINAALNGGTNVSIQTSSGIGGTGAIVINGSADAGGAVAISNTSSGPRELRLNTTGTINMHAGASIAGSFSHPLDVIMLAGAGASSIGGSINTLGQVTIASSGTLSVGAITTTLPSNNYSWDLTLRAPALTIHDNIQAKNASLQADNPITVLAGKTVIASNDLQFVNFTNSNPMIVSATGLVNVGDLSVLSGAGVFKAPTFDFYSGSTLTVNGAPVGLSGIRLFGTNITINDNLLTTSTVSLSADNPITVATGKTVIASNGAATNPYGHLYFSPYTYSNPLTVGSTGLVNVANLSPLSGTGVFRSSSLGFGSGGLLTVNTAPVGFNQISLNAPTITINDSILATSSVSLQADNPITVATGKTVIASNGAAINPSGSLSFSPYSSGNLLTVGSTGLVSGANLSPLSGTGVFRASSLIFNSPGSSVAVTSPLAFAGFASIYSPIATISSTGTLDVSNLSIYAANGFVNSGSLSGIGSINVGTGANGFVNQGIISPAGASAIGTLSVTGDMQLAAGSELNMDLGASGQRDQINVSGAISGNAGSFGTVALNRMVVSSTPALAGETFGLMTAASGLNSATFVGMTVPRAVVTPAYAAGTFSVNVAPKVLTVTGDAASKVYGSADPAFTYSVTGMEYGDTAASSVSGALGRVAGNNVGSYAYAAGTLNSPLGYYIEVATPVLAPGSLFGITPKALDLTSIAKVYDGSTSATGSSGTFTGLVSTDVVTLASVSGSFDSKNAGSRTVTGTTATLGGAQAGNYILNPIPPSISGVITPKTLSVSASASNKVYDGNTSAVLSGGALSGVVGSDVVTLGGLSGSFYSKNVGTGKTVTYSVGTLAGADAANYQLRCCQQITFTT